MIYIVPKKDNKLDDKLYLEWVNLIESREDVDMEEYLDVITNISISSNLSIQPVSFPS